MIRIRNKGEEIKLFLLANIESHPQDLSNLAVEHFHISRQAVNKHLHVLQTEGAISITGKTRNRSYELVALVKWSGLYRISPNLAEDIVWRDAIRPVLENQPENIISIWHYGFTEIFNNAIDHSGGDEIFVQINITAANTEIFIMDNGIGIFKKIQTELNLLDERHAILELSKGKLTTNPANHTGEGIFFVSKMLDSFDILSGGVFFTQKFSSPKDWIIERNSFEHGTSVWMRLSNHTVRTAKEIFSSFASPDNDSFAKTVVPVRLAQYGNDKLISRSQAKRLLARVELFRTVIFNFEGVQEIGQSFADEIFRVFVKHHPEITILNSNANPEVHRMIERAKLGEIPITEVNTK
jgi:anti-sigma regulatory factor (Ser/Thr protein kinase)